jgi:hypothetical protein
MARVAQLPWYHVVDITSGALELARTSATSQRCDSENKQKGPPPLPAREQQCSPTSRHSSWSCSSSPRQLCAPSISLRQTRPCPCPLSCLLLRILMAHAHMKMMHIYALVPTWSGNILMPMPPCLNSPSSLQGLMIPAMRATINARASAPAMSNAKPLNRRAMVRGVTAAFVFADVAAARAMHAPGCGCGNCDARNSAGAHGAGCSCGECAAHGAGCSCGNCMAHGEGCACAACSPAHSAGCACAACQ